MYRNSSLLEQVSTRQQSFNQGQLTSVFHYGVSCWCKASICN